MLIGRYKNNITPAFTKWSYLSFVWTRWFLVGIFVDGISNFIISKQIYRILIQISDID